MEKRTNTTAWGDDMKRWLLTIVFCLISLSFISCQKSPVILIDSGVLESDNYDYRFVHKGDVIDFGFDHYGGTSDFDSIAIHCDETVARSDYKEQLTFIEVGATRVTIDLIQNDHVLKTLDYGVFYVVDIGDSDISYVSTYYDFSNAVENHPNGIIVLTGDILITTNLNPITTTFGGAILNPHGYVIRTLDNLVLTHPLFDYIQFAYIDGLILEGFVMENVSGALANRITTSVIANVKVEADIVSNRNDVGGISGEAIGARFESVVFRGSIKSNNPSGLVGVSYSYGLFGQNFYFIYYYATNCVVIAQLQGNDDYDSRIFGFSRNDSGLAFSIRNSYFTGSVILKEDDTWNLNYVHTGVLLSYPLVFDHLLTTIPVNPNCSGEDCLIPYADTYISFITEETLTSGEVIQGFESFSYEIGEYPMPPVFEIPWLT